MYFIRVRHNFLLQTTAMIKYRLAHGPWTLMVQNIIESLYQILYLSTHTISVQKLVIQ
jgi:hypothetical protein